MAHHGIQQCWRSAAQSLHVVEKAFDTLTAGALSVDLMLTRKSRSQSCSQPYLVHQEVLPFFWRSVAQAYHFCHSVYQQYASKADPQVVAYQQFAFG